MDDNWMGVGPSEYGFGAGQADSGSGGVTSGVESAVTTRASGHPPVYSPDNPLFWVGILIAATAGLITISTAVHVGPIKGKATI